MPGKLTFLLRDSLDGNSKTIIAACISPSVQDSVFTGCTHTHSHACRHSSMLCTLAALAHQHSKALCFGETLSTLKFAARAKHIRCTVLIWVQKIWNCIKLWHCLLYLALSRFLFEASPSVCFNHRRNNVVPQSEAVMNEEYSGTVESLLEARRFLLLSLLKCWWVCMWMLCLTCLQKTSFWFSWVYF